MLTFGRAAYIRQTIGFELEDTAPIREEEQRIMGVDDQQMCYVVVLVECS